MTRLAAMLTLLFSVLLSSSPAWAGPVRIEARVTDDLRAITGTIVFDDPDEPQLIDPLERWPVPEKDRDLMRTYPTHPEQGVVRFQRIGPGRYMFQTLLPRRYGDLGALKNHGLFANGGWYPQPITSDGVPQMAWQVTLALPEGAVGALGDQVGSGVLRWSGAGERVSLAVLPRGVVTPLNIEGAELQLLTRSTPKKRVVLELETALAIARPDGVPLKGAIVVAPLRRRLVRAGLGLTYLSDRAFRVTPGLFGFHRTTVTRGVLQGSLALSDPFERELAAAAAATQYARAARTASLDQALRHVRWNPVVDAAINDRTIPFWGDVMGRTHPSDEVKDDLLEVLDPHTPGTVVVAQLEDAYGPGVAWILASGVLEGSTLAEAAREADIPVGALEAWRDPYPEQNYTLNVDRSEQRITVTRRAPPHAQAETLVVRLDERREIWRTEEGPDVLVLEPSPFPKKVNLDPGRHVGQTDRRGDSWPAPLVFTGAGWIDTINFTDFYITGWVGLFVRRRYDTHNTFGARLFVDNRNLPGLTLSYSRKFGRLRDGLRRHHSLHFALTPSFLNPRFTPSDTHDFSIGGSANYVWNTTTSHDFPIHGHTLVAGVRGGVVPQTLEHWFSTSLGVTAIAGFDLRNSLALRAHGALAWGDNEDQLLWFGGAGTLASLPPATVIGRRRFIGKAEYRTVLLRNISVNLFALAWVSQVQLSVGAEAGTVWDGERWSEAVGATASLLANGDVLGVNPMSVGVTVAVPMWLHGIELEHRWRPQVFVAFNQHF